MTPFTRYLVDEAGTATAPGELPSSSAKRSGGHPTPPQHLSQDRSATGLRTLDRAQIRWWRRYSLLMVQDHQQVACFVQDSPAFRSLLLSRQVAPPFREPYPSAPELASEILADPEFQALRLATWLRSPDGELIAKSVAQVIPPAYRLEFGLAVEALHLAADMQYEQGAPQRAAGAVALAVVTIFGVVFAAPAARRLASTPPSA